MPATRRARATASQQIRLLPTIGPSLARSPSPPAFGPAVFNRPSPTNPAIYVISYPSHDPTPTNYTVANKVRAPTIAGVLGSSFSTSLTNLRFQHHSTLSSMMMTASPTNLLQSPKLSSAMNSLSVKRPNLSPLKRKLSDDDETPSPTSTDEVPDERVVSPLKKTKLSDSSSTNSTPTSSTWSSALALDDDEPMDGTIDGSDEACAKVLAAYTPTSWDEQPAASLDEEELEILEYFLA